MCVLYVSFGSKVRSRTVGCNVMGSAVLFILRSKLLLYSVGSGVNRVQVVLPGFSVRWFCFIQAKTLCKYGCMYFLAAFVLVCVDVMVMCKGCDGRYVFCLYCDAWSCRCSCMGSVSLCICCMVVCFLWQFSMLHYA